MARKKDNDGIKRITGTGSTKGVQRTEGVSEVDKIEKTSGIQKVSETSKVSAIRLEQRDKLFSMISEEAQKLAAQGIIPKSQREVVEKAVQMVIDAALIDESAENPGKNKK
jgi:hypothetical protein